MNRIINIITLVIIFSFTTYSQNSIRSRFSTPQDYQRVQVAENSFEEFLQNLPLKPQNTLVKYYNGEIKQNHNVYDAVIDLDIGNKNLHQCADAVMRLRAEYLWNTKQYDKIHFNFTNGFQVDYIEWMKGRRVIVEGNKTYWNNRSFESNTYQDFWKYMELIFAYAGTASLSKELDSKPANDINIGDVFIIGGFPGHAVIVVDMAKNIKTGKKIFLLAQSYMPAQETQILKNPNSQKLSPWYSEDFGDILKTPEFTFSKNDLKQFKNE